MPTSRPLILAVLLATASQAPVAAESALELWEAWYSVSARVRTKRIDADLEAGGRLAMARRADPSGKLTLSLAEVLEHPWKLYWVDPLGPIGEEVKVASVVTLREASWEALAEAETENKISAADQHRRWSATAERPRPLDGSFAFAVIGDPRDGFSFDIAPKGRVANITNRLTDRWLFGPFDQFVNKPASEDREPAPAPVGYWFWNHGEEEPHGYEPHTYHAFAAALALLALELPPVSEPAASAEPAVIWLHVGQRANRVLSILAPRMDAATFLEELPAQTRVSSTREALPAGGIRLTLTSPVEASQPHIDRETVFSSEGRPVSDRVRVRIIGHGRAASLEVETGYRPWNAQQESP